MHGTGSDAQAANQAGQDAYWWRDADDVALGGTAESAAATAAAGQQVHLRVGVAGPLSRQVVARTAIAEIAANRELTSGSYVDTHVQDAAVESIQEGIADIQFVRTAAADLADPTGKGILTGTFVDTTTDDGTSILSILEQDSGGNGSSGVAEGGRVLQISGLQAGATSRRLNVNAWVTSCDAEYFEVTWGTSSSGPWNALVPPIQIADPFFSSSVTDFTGAISNTANTTLYVRLYNGQNMGTTEGTLSGERDTTLFVDYLEIVDSNGSFFGLGDLVPQHAWDFGGEAWMEVGVGSATGGGVSDDSADSLEPAIALDAAGNPVVTWTDYGTYEIYVRRFDGSVWRELAGSASGTGISNSSGYAGQADVEIGPDGQPVVAWSDNASGAYQIYVKRFNGTSWVEVGAGSASGSGVSGSAGGNFYPDMKLRDSGYPVIAWTNGLGAAGEICVKQFSGSVWSFVGPSCAAGGVSNLPGSSDANAKLALTPGGQPVVAWERNGPQIYLRQWNGSSWVELAGSATGGGVSQATIPPGADSASIGVDASGLPFVAYEDNDSYQYYVKHYNGSSWDVVGGGPVSVGGGATALAVQGDDLPVLAYRDSSSGAVHLERFNGAAWEELDGSATGNGVSGSPGGKPDLALDAHDNPILAWEYTGGGDKEVYVRRHGDQYAHILTITAATTGEPFLLGWGTSPSSPNWPGGAWRVTSTSLTTLELDFSAAGFSGGLPYVFAIDEDRSVTDPTADTLQVDFLGVDSAETLVWLGLERDTDPAFSAPIQVTSAELWNDLDHDSGAKMTDVQAVLSGTTAGLGQAFVEARPPDISAQVDVGAGQQGEWDFAVTAPLVGGTYYYRVVLLAPTGEKLEVLSSYNATAMLTVPGGNAAPIVTSVTAVPAAVTPAGTQSTTLSCVFSDADVPLASTFDVTMRVREPNDSTVLTLCSGVSHGGACGGAGAGSLTVSGTNPFTASVSWDPPLGATNGLYDLDCTVVDQDGTGDSGSSAFAANLDELELDGTAPSGFAITSVAGDATAPYEDTVDEAPNTTQVSFFVTGASNCHWDTSDASYSSMANDCASVSVCVLAGATANSTAYTYYIACVDAVGNENGAADNLDVQWTNSFPVVAPETTINSGPAHYTNSSTALLTFSSDTGTQYAHRLDGGVWSGWSGGTSVDLSPAADGQHVFEVKARDASLVEDASPASYAWRVIASPTTVDLSSGGTPGYWVYGEGRFDFAGFALALGDTDGDTFDDLVVGAPNAEGFGGAQALTGRVYLIRGRAGFAGGIDLGASAAKTVFYGAAFNDQLGAAVATGDVNGDGCADLLLSSPLSAEAVINGGVVTLVFGRGPGCAVSTVCPEDWDLSDPPEPEFVTIYGAEANDITGLSVTTGDVNGDTYDDIIIDAESGSPAGRTMAGRAYVVFGRAHSAWDDLSDMSDPDPGLFPARLDLAIAARSLQIYGAEGSETGVNGGDGLRVVAATDLTGDGNKEIVLLAPGADGAGNARPDAGEAYVILGDAGLAPGTVLDLGTQAPAMIIYGASASDALSVAGAGGNLNADLSGSLNALNDLVFASYTALSGQGALYVVFGAETLPSSVDLGAGGWGLRVRGGAAGQALGTSALLTDLDGDGYADLVAGAWTGTNAGKVVVLGGADFAAGQVDFDLSTVSPNRTYQGRAAGSLFSFNLAAGRANGDSYPDLLISAVFSSGDGTIPAGRERDYCGEAYLFLGGP